MRLQGRRILITGAASGIGRATAELFAGHGARVALVDRDAEGVRKAARDVGGHAELADLLVEDTVRNAVDQAAQALGGLDGLVHAAGVHAVASFAETAPDMWRRMLDINLTGAFLVCRAVLPWLMLEPAATIVNIASGQAVTPNLGNAAYAASKAGVVALTKTLALELAPRIRANVIAPGAVQTPMVTGEGGTLRDASSDVMASMLERYALKRMAHPGEIAQALLFLSSHESSFVTGSLLGVDGGRIYH